MKEWHLQSYVSTQLHRLGILHHGDQNAGKRGPRASGIAKATGMCAGWPDMVVIGPGGKTTYLELKLTGKPLSAAQKRVHAEFAKCGIIVHKVEAGSKEEAWEKVKMILGLQA